MSFQYQCPTCVSGGLISRVTIKGYDNSVLVSGAFFDVSGSLVRPTFKKTITTLCSNGHTVVKVVPKIPSALAQNLEYFVDTP